jgi:hypothetical protein
MTNATILIDQNHHSGQPHLVAHYEMGGLKGQMQFAAAIDLLQDFRTVD